MNGCEMDSFNGYVVKAEGVCHQGGCIDYKVLGETLSVNHSSNLKKHFLNVKEVSGPEMPHPT